MKGYTSVEDVAEYLNREFTPAQNALCDKLIDVVEELIDVETTISFNPSEQQSDNFFEPSPLITVANPPIDITKPYSVSARSNFTAEVVPLHEGTQFELRSAKLGVFYVAFLDYNSIIDPQWYGRYDRVQINYWTIPTVPRRVWLAANISVAHYMRASLNDEIPGLARFGNGELLTMYTTKVMEEGLPAEATRLLKNIGPRFILA